MVSGDSWIIAIGDAAALLGLLDWFGGSDES